MPIAEEPTNESERSGHERKQGIGDRIDRVTSGDTPDGTEELDHRIGTDRRDRPVLHRRVGSQEAGTETSNDEPDEDDHEE